MSKVAIAVSTYNNPEHIVKLLKSCQGQMLTDYEIFIADDGSSDNTVAIIEGFARKDSKIHLQKLKHGERGIARQTAISEALKEKPTFLLIIDSDMIMKKNLLKEAVNKLEKNPLVKGLVIKEIPYTKYNNYYSKVKVFERRVINNSGKELDVNSIEAARFWRSDAYIDSGGIDPKEIAFEEIQPTIRTLEQGGIIEKLMVSGLYHDEKDATLKNILEKKKYYFKMMNTTIETEEKGLYKAVSRWYLFRPVYYRLENIYLYIKHPALTFGMLLMYLLLTFVGGYELLIHSLRTKFKSVNN